MIKKHWITKFSGVVMLLALLASEAVQAQYFGRNKPKYQNFDFEVLRTPNFEIYSYLKNDSTLKNLGVQTERWYKRHQLVLEDTFSNPNPLIMYNNHPDFQQTDVVGGLIGIGTGGVTEALKNRVVMPFMFTNHQTDHVLGHELVHAFQFHLITEGDSTNLSSLRNLPLWLVEGLAEYMSIGREDPHTAMWMRDAVMHDDIPSLDDLTKKPNKYFPYRYGQAFWAFVTGIWGDEVIRPLYLETAKYGIEMALKQVLGVDSKTLSNMWKTKLINTYKPLMNDTIATVGRKMFDSENAGNMNFMPVLSPDGKYLVFLSERDLISIDMFIAEAETGKILHKLNRETMRMHIDDYNYLESPGTFSPDSKQFAYVIFSKGKNKLMIVDVENGKRIREIEIPGVPSISYPAWSPDGTQLAFSGLVNGHSDLYLFDLQTDEVTNLTNDRYSDIQPDWSSDGSKIVFVSDRGSDTDLDELEFGKEKISIIDVLSKSVEVLDVFPNAQNMDPHFSEDDTRVYFLSTADGFRNLYEHDLRENRTFRLTRLFTGISGITAYSPAVTVENGKVAYSVYRNHKYSIYQAPVEEFEREPFNFYNVSARAATLPPMDTLAGKNLVMIPDSKIVRDVKEDSFKMQEYEPRFRLSYIGNSGVGVATGPLGTGMNGGVNMLFSDVLNDNQLFAGVQVNGEIYDIGGQFAYLNRKSRFNWGASISHIPFQFMSVGLLKDSINLGGEMTEVDNLAYFQQRIFQDQVSLFGQIPFSQTLRLEAGTSFSRYSYRQDVINNYHYRGMLVKQDREKLPSPEGFSLGNAYLAYVGDNSKFGLTSPITGQRFRFQAEKVFGEADYYGVLADYRKYIWMKPFTLAFRGMHYGRFGNNIRTFNPMYIGNDFLVRGYNSGSFVNNGSGFNVNNLAGNSMAVANAELRMPFTGPEKLALFKSGFLFSDLALFADAGLAWDADSKVKFSWEAEENARTPIVSAGLALRVNLFGFMVLEPYYAIPFQRGIGGVTGLTISAGGW